MERKYCQLKLADVTDAGTFRGHASIKTNVDLGRDKVLGGAFTKTLKENASEGVPILWQHFQHEVIGKSTSLVEDTKGLEVGGALVLEVQRALEAHALLKARAVKGLSIGYDVIKETFEKGVRLLHELKLYEFSIVTFPMNPLAQVEAVKSLAARGNKFAESFESMNERAQLIGAKYTMFDTLARVLDEVVHGPYDGTTKTDDERVSFLSTSLDEFKSAMLAWVPEMRNVLYADGEEKARAFLLATKEGRVLNSRNTRRVRDVLETLQALLAEADSSEPQAHSEGSTTGTEAATPDATTNTEKGLDSLISEFKARLPK